MAQNQTLAGLRSLVTDPTFYGRKPEERRSAIAEFVPEFPELDAAEQDAILGKLESKFRVVGAEQTGLPGVPRFTGEKPPAAKPGVNFAEGTRSVFLTKEQRERGETGLLDTPGTGKVGPSPVEELSGHFSRSMFGLITGVGNAGVAMGFENIGGGLATVGRTAEDLVFKPDPRDGKDFIEDPAKLTDPFYLSEIFGSAAGSMVGFAGAGSAAARGASRAALALKLSDRGRRIAATIGGTSVASVFETVVQSGQSYGEALDLGASPETAAEVAAQTAKNTLGPTLALNAAGLYNETIKSGVRRVFADVGGEIAQETAQQIGTNLAFSGTGVDPERPALEGVPEAALGGLAGGVVGGSIVGGGTAAETQQDSAPVVADAGAGAGASGGTPLTSAATASAREEAQAQAPAEPDGPQDIFAEAKEFIESSEKITKKDIREHFGLTRDEGESLIDLMVDGGVLTRDKEGRIGRPAPQTTTETDQAQPPESAPAAETPPIQDIPAGMTQPATPIKEVQSNEALEAKAEPSLESTKAAGVADAKAGEAAPARPIPPDAGKTPGHVIGPEDIKAPAQKKPTREEIRERDMEAAERAAEAAAEKSEVVEAEEPKKAAAPPKPPARAKFTASRIKALVEQAPRTLAMFPKMRGTPEFSRVEELSGKLKSDPASTDPQELADAQTILAKRAAGKTITPAMVDSPGAKEFLRGPESKPTVDIAAEKQTTTARVKPTHVPEQAQPTDSGFKIRVDDLDVEPERFQFKIEARNKRGVTDKLAGVEKFDPSAARSVLVWKDPADGRAKVIDGHHRVDLAKRLNVNSIEPHFIEAENEKQARAIGALANIREGNASPTSVANFMRDSGTTVADLKKHGIPVTQSVVGKAEALTKIPDNVFRRITLGAIHEEHGIAVGRATDDHVAQGKALEVIEAREQRTGKKVDADLAESIARRVAGAGQRTETQATLFGDIETTDSLFEQEAQLIEHVKSKLASEKRLFSTVAKSDAAKKLEGVGNVLAGEKNAAIAEDAGQARAVFDTLVDKSGPINDIIRKGAQQIAEGKSTAEVQKKTLEAIRAEVRSLIGSRLEGGRAGNQEDTGKGGLNFSRTDADGNPVRDKHNSNGNAPGFLDPSMTFPCQ